MFGGEKNHGIYFTSVQDLRSNGGIIASRQRSDTDKTSDVLAACWSFVEEGDLPLKLDLEIASSDQPSLSADCPSLTDIT